MPEVSQRVPRGWLPLRSRFLSLIIDRIGYQLNLIGWLDLGHYINITSHLGWWTGMFFNWWPVMSTIIPVLSTSRRSDPCFRGSTSSVTTISWRFSVSRRTRTWSRLTWRSCSQASTVWSLTTTAITSWPCGPCRGRSCPLRRRSRLSPRLRCVDGYV